MKKRLWSNKVEAALTRGKSFNIERKRLLENLPEALTRVWMPIENLRRKVAFREGVLYLATSGN